MKDLGPYMAEHMVVELEGSRAVEAFDWNVADNFGEFAVGFSFWIKFLYFET